MNIHEFQAKKLLADHGIPVPSGCAATSLEEAEAAMEALPDGPVVVKAQIHAGGRGVGTFSDGFEGGVRVASSKEEALEFARRMLGNTLITHQTGSAGRLVRTIYLAEYCEIAKEYYLAILVDRTTSRPVIIASTEGGVDIERVAQERPERIVRVSIDPTLGLLDFQARSVAFALGLANIGLKQVIQIIGGLYRLFWEKDASLVEINPLIVIGSGELVALDAKVAFDDTALYRHPEIAALRDPNEENPREVEASRHSLNYIALDGDIACMVNGAGLAMATMDIIKHFGGSPANFLDVGGGATEEQVTKAFEIILGDENIRGILVNIFGGIMHCDIIARGIIGAAATVEISVPLVVRLEGTNVEEGRALLAESGLKIETAKTLSEAAEKIVSLSLSDGKSD